MSKAKFAAAKELIEEHHYDEARTILRTINHPTAKKWLERLDQLDPPHAQRKRLALQTEQEKFYRQQNRDRRRRRTGRALDLLFFGIGSFFVGIILTYISWTGDSISCLPLCPFPLGVVAFSASFWLFVTD